VAFQSWVAEESNARREARKLGKPYRDLYEALRRSTKAINGRVFRRWMNRIERIWRQGWDKQDRVQLGSALITYLVEHSCGNVQLDVSRHSGKTHTYIVLTDKARQIIEDRRARAEVMCPLRRPMLCPSKPWQWNPETGTYEGGFYLIPDEFIRSGVHGHTADLKLEQPLSVETIEATNILQRAGDLSHLAGHVRVLARPARREPIQGAGPPRPRRPEDDPEIRQARAGRGRGRGSGYPGSIGERKGGVTARPTRRDGDEMAYRG
jgi:hypothetical protein